MAASSEDKILGYLIGDKTLCKNCAEAKEDLEELLIMEEAVKLIDGEIEKDEMTFCEQCGQQLW